MSQEERQSRQHGFRVETHRVGKFGTVSISWSGRSSRVPRPLLSALARYGSIAAIFILVSIRVPAEVKSGDAAGLLGTVLQIVMLLSNMAIAWSIRADSDPPRSSTEQACANQAASRRVRRIMVITFALNAAVIVMMLAQWLVELAAGHVTPLSTAMTALALVFYVGFEELLWRLLRSADSDRFA